MAESPLTTSLAALSRFFVGDGTFHETQSRSRDTGRRRSSILDGWERGRSGKRDARLSAQPSDHGFDR